MKANYDFFLSCVKSVPDLASQPGFFATGTDERLLLRGRRMTSDHLGLRCGELGDGGGVVACLMLIELLVLPVCC